MPLRDVLSLLLCVASVASFVSTAISLSQAYWAAGAIHLIVAACLLGLGVQLGATE